MRRRHELTDAQWTAIEHLLPGKATDPGRTAEDNRLFVNAVLYVLKTGVPWADLPERFGNSNSIWRRFDRWCEKGIWEQIYHTLGEDDLEEELQEVHLDSSIIKAHQTASTGRRRADEKKTRPTNDVAWAGHEAD